MKIPGTIREIKFRRDSFEAALATLKPLNLGESKVENVEDTYLKGVDTTRKVYKVGGEPYLVEITRDGKGFGMKFTSISEDEAEGLINKYGIDKTMRKKRIVWSINDVQVAIDEVAGLGGVFIEVQGENIEEPMKILEKIGVDSSQLITQPYNKL